MRRSPVIVIITAPSVMVPLVSFLAALRILSQGESASDCFRWTELHSNPCMHCNNSSLLLLLHSCHVFWSPSFERRLPLLHKKWKSKQKFHCFWEKMRNGKNDVRGIWSFRISRWFRTWHEASSDLWQEWPIFRQLLIRSSRNRNSFPPKITCG